MLRAFGSYPNAHFNQVTSIRRKCLLFPTFYVRNEQCDKWKKQGNYESLYKR
ncbi:hypothetical protein [Bacillus timonensis]|uniref:hypothetical protein n=1 Tax=Bacillus timonensis TaxID=1033734 RepID=UPI0002E06BFA|nr:hypothetical protein [Bacillus timonensis]